MKKYYSLILVSILTLNTFGQVLDSKQEPIIEEEKREEKKEEKKKDEIQTLFSRDKSFGGYFDIYFNYTELKQTEALEVGSRLSMIVGHSLAFGVEGTGFVSNVFKDDLNNDYFIGGGYGGFTIEPIVLPKFPVHASFPVMLGGGASIYSSIDNNYEGNAYVEEVEGFLLARPGVEVEFNITRYFRFCLNGYYRFIADIGSDNTRSVTAKDLEGFSFGISFKLGKF